MVRQSADIWCYVVARSSTQAIVLNGNCKELFSSRLTDVQVRSSQSKQARGSTHNVDGWCG